MASHKALGRGLNALFSSAQAQTKKSIESAGAASPDGENKSTLGVQEISVLKIFPNRHQPRTHFNEEALSELSESIKIHGVQQPLVVTPSIQIGQYELVVGERRLRASKLAGLATVPCIVKKFTNQQRFEIALIENLQREDLNALEEAIALNGLMKEYGLTQEQVAKSIGKSRSTVANILRFLRLHEDVQAALANGSITEGHAKILAGLSEDSEQLRFLKKIIDESLTVRDLEAVLGAGASRIKKSSAIQKAPPVPEARKYEEDLQRLLGRRVEIQSKGKKGWIRFAFYSPWDLENLLKRLELIPGTPEAEQDPS